MKKVAITGGVASGKSTVCRAFQELGAYTVSADAIVHELLLVDTDLSQQIVHLLGHQVLVNGVLDRRAIADIVFKDPEALHVLEKLLHPAVLRRIEEIYVCVLREGRHALFVVEVPLLYEAEQDQFYDAVIAVVTDEATAMERFCRAGFTTEEWHRRMKRQWSSEQKAKRATAIIYNNGSLEQLREQVVQCSHQLQL